ncbi:MAG: hypothetical protein ABIH08_04695 [Candidatus Omnitrophota bacterium]
MFKIIKQNNLEKNSFKKAAIADKLFRLLFFSLLIGAIAFGFGYKVKVFQMIMPKRIFGQQELPVMEESAGFFLPLDKYGREDPFNPVFNEKAIVSSTGLSGIIWDEQNPKAIINGEIIGIGEEIGSNKIIKIEQNKVILSDGSSEFELKLAR